MSIQVALPPADDGLTTADLFGTAVEGAEEAFNVSLPDPVGDEEEDSLSCMRRSFFLAIICVSGRWRDLSCNCRSACLEKFRSNVALASAVGEFQQKVATMNASERSKFFFNLMRRMAGDIDRGLLDHISQWKFLGQAVCFNAFLALTGTSNRLKGRSRRVRRESPL